MKKCKQCEVMISELREFCCKACKTKFEIQTLEFNLDLAIKLLPTKEYLRYKEMRK